MKIIAIKSVPPPKTVSVLTTLSFATNPVIKAVDMRQSPKPSGAKTGVITPAITARILFEESVEILK